MTTSAQQLNSFFQACEKLMNEKYMVADARIADVLKAIAECRALTDLFSAVTERFDYPSAKKTYLRFPSSVGAFHGKALLPKDRGEVLAFVFCLLVDIDAGRIKFDDFLLRYFYEDGSYTASFAIFSDRMLRPFRDIVRDCFPDFAKPEIDSGAQTSQAKNDTIEKISALAIEERARLASVSLSAVDSAAGDLILCELIQAAGKSNLSETKALIAGYRYFLRALFLEGGEELLKVGRSLD